MKRARAQSTFAAWLEELPDMVARAAEDGRPVRIPASAIAHRDPELVEARRRLLATLGVAVDDKPLGSGSRDA